MIETLVAMAMLVWAIALGLAPAWMGDAKAPRFTWRRLRPMRLHYLFLT